LGELLAALALFTAWQAALPPVTGRVAFLPRWSGVRVQRGSRWTWLSPWPIAAGFVAAERALALREGGVAARFPRPGEVRGEAAYDELGQARSRGRKLCLGRRVLCRCVTRRHAERLAELLRRVAASEPSTRAGVLSSLARAGFDEAHRAQLMQRAQGPLRWLARLSSGSLLGTAAVGLAAAASRFEERLLLLSLPLLGLVHLASVVALFLAHRAIDPEDASGRLETVFSALFFPPAAWTAAQHLRCEIASRWHPALMGAALLDREALLDLLRTELALLARASGLPETCETEQQLLDTERSALLVLAEARELSEQELAKPRVRRDCNAASYCVVCGSDYRPGFDWCRECAVPTLAYRGDVG
jgi:hypothetical protein